MNKKQSSKKKKGFTLIELLVVVLIICILSAIAVPRYKLAVEKNRAKLILAVMKDISKAENIYQLTHGQYTGNFQELDIDLPYKSISKDKTSSYITTSDGLAYALSVEAGYFNLTGGTKKFSVMSFQSTYLLCYPRNNDLGKQICRSLGCLENELNNLYCILRDRAKI